MDIETVMAIEAFREVERINFLLERKKFALKRALKQDVNMAEYAEETSKIIADFSERMEKFDQQSERDSRFRARAARPRNNQHR